VIWSVEKKSEMKNYNTTRKMVKAIINETLTLLDTPFNLDETQLHKNVVLLFGLAGVGTSTLSQFLAGNPELKATKDGSHGRIYITDGNNKVNEFTTESKSFSPELVPLPTNDTVLADCPGFSDTRSAQHDIATAFFTKQLLDKLNKVKILVVIPQHYVQRGGGREGFTSLLVHLVYFIKDINKYKDSIGLVVTKVENEMVVDDNGNYQFVKDDEIINEIGTFLDKVKVEFMQKPKNYLMTKQIKLINIFVAKNDSNKYSKIGIMRRPIKTGTLNSNKRMIENRAAIHMIIQNALLTTQVNSYDFELTLSMPKTLVSKMLEILNTRLSNTLDEYIMIYSQKPLHYPGENMKTAITRDVTIIELLESAITPDLVISNLMDRIGTLDPEHPAEKFADWKKQEKYIQLLESIAPTNRDTDDFEKYHVRIGHFKKLISDKVKSKAQNAEETIDNDIGEIIAEIITAVKNETVYLDRSSQLSYLEFSKRIDDVSVSCEKFKAKYQNRNNLSFREFLKDFKANFNISEIQKEKLEHYQTDIEFFKVKVTATNNYRHQEKWLQGFTEPLNDIKKVADWFAFITDSFTELIDYDTQNVMTQNHQNLKNWPDFKVFLKKLGTNKALESRPTLTAEEQIDLDNLIDATNPALVHYCESSKLIVEGNVIKLSEVKKSLIPKCPSFEELNIFASLMVFIDVSLTQPMKNLYIIAPTWKVKGKNRLINLRGLNANPKGQTPAGEPGQPGGNFIGIGDKFVNEKELAIDVSGGNGGNGEDGTNGQDGQDGLTPSTPRKTIWYKVRSLELLAHMLDSHDYCEHRIKYEEIAGFANEGGGRFKMFGTKGTPGSPGRNGGKPGYGAQPGIILMESSSNIKKFAFPGKNGAEGSGGQGGRGGKHGETRSILCNTITHNTLFKFEYISVSLENQGRAENGNNGASGETGNLVEAAQPQSFVPLSKVVEQYKQFVQRKNFRFVDSLGFIDRHVSDIRKRRSISTTPVVDNADWTPPPLAIGSGNMKNMSWPSGFPLSSFMTLADVLIRKLFKINPTNFDSQTDITWENLLVQAEVLKMVEKCETTWKDENRNQLEQLLFDPVCLQRELKWHLKKLMADKSWETEN
jgi:hypothetical protein